MGPLGKLWVMVEEARTSIDQDPAELLSSEEVAQTVEKTVTLVGQVINLMKKNLLTTATGYSTSETAAILNDITSFSNTR